MIRSDSVATSLTIRPGPTFYDMIIRFVLTALLVSVASVPLFAQSNASARMKRRPCWRT